MQLSPDYSYDPQSTNEVQYLDTLYSIFLNDLVHAGLRWRPTGLPLSLRRQPEIDGRHAVFWHIVSGGSNIEENRTLDLDRCARLKWVRSIIDQFNSGFPDEKNVCWWKSPDPRWRGSRYGIATLDFDYVIFIDERPSYALLVSAYYVERERRRLKFKREHDEYWK